MASRETANSQNEDKDGSQHRRSRLWLGYSEDDLRNSQKNEGRRSSTPEDTSAINERQAQRSQRNQSLEEYTVPTDYDNLDEVAAPSPTINPPRGRLSGYLEDRNARPAVGGSSGVFKESENLDEVAGPSPIDHPRRDREQAFSESSRTHRNPYEGQGILNDFEGLGEATALSPFPDSRRGRKSRQNGDLEDQTVQTSSTEEERLKESKHSQQLHRVSKIATQLYTISYLILFSILGTLARLGLQALTFYPGAPVQIGLLWANVGGSLVMGFLSEDQKLFRQEWGTIEERRNDREYNKSRQRGASADKRHAAVKKTLPLYIGLTTGFCGSFTSFSSFMRDAFFALSNALPVPIQHPSSSPISQTVSVHRNPGYSFLALLAVLIVTIGLSLMALQFGAHIALFLEPFTPSIPYLFSRKVVDRLVVFLAFGCWFAAILMSIWPPDRPGGSVGNVSLTQETWRSQALFALVFAPLGCLLRFYAAIHLNGRINAVPLGTFMVNVLGTALEGMFLDLQRAPVGGMVGCQVLQGMSDGFCGCLTTVSTWVLELSGLRLRHAYFYGLSSVGVALGLLIIITGSLQWTRGFSHPLCMA